MIRRALFILAAASASGCFFLVNNDETCDADHACADGFSCQQGLCVKDTSSTSGSNGSSGATSGSSGGSTGSTGASGSSGSGSTSGASRPGYFVSPGFGGRGTLLTVVGDFNLSDTCSLNASTTGTSLGNLQPASTTRLTTRIPANAPRGALEIRRNGTVIGTFTVTEPSSRFLPAPPVALDGGAEDVALVSVSGSVALLAATGQDISQYAWSGTAFGSGSSTGLAVPSQVAFAVGHRVGAATDDWAAAPLNSVGPVQVELDSALNTVTPSSGLKNLGVAVADVDLDGFDDVLVASLGHVEIFRGSDGGLNTASDKVNATGLGQLTDLAVADMNHDGVLDLVYAAQDSAGDGGIRYLPGQAGGSYGSAVPFGGNVSEPSTFAIGDFNEDAQPDVAIVDGTENIDVILRADGGGTRSLGVAGLRIAALHAWDVNGDGHLDLVAANGAGQLGNLVSVLEGYGDGGFAPPYSLRSGDYPIALAAGDLNGDGRIDLVAGNDRNKTVSVFLGQAGEAVWNVWPQTATAGSQLTLRGADFKPTDQVSLFTADQVQSGGPGISGATTYVDPGTLVATAGRAAGRLLAGIHLSDGGAIAAPSANVNAYFAESSLDAGPTYSMPRPVIAMSTGYFTNNLPLRPEVAVAFANSPQIQVFENAGGAGGELLYTRAEDAYGLGDMNAVPVAMQVFDANHDGVDDLVVLSNSSSGAPTISVFFASQDGSGALDLGFEGALPPGTARDMVAADFNDDGITDLAISTQNDTALSDIQVLFGNADGSFGTWSTIFGSALGDSANWPNVLPQDVTALSVAELNGDAAPDLLYIGDNNVVVGTAVNDGQGDFFARELATGATYAAVAAGYPKPGDPPIALALSTDAGFTDVFAFAAGPDAGFPTKVQRLTGTSKSGRKIIFEPIGAAGSAMGGVAGGSVAILANDVGGSLLTFYEDGGPDAVTSLASAGTKATSIAVGNIRADSDNNRTADVLAIEGDGGTLQLYVGAP